jgi:hypothetical protein
MSPFGRLTDSRLMVIVLSTLYCFLTHRLCASCENLQSITLLVQLRETRRTRWTLYTRALRSACSRCDGFWASFPHHSSNIIPLVFRVVSPSNIVGRLNKSCPSNVQGRDLYKSTAVRNNLDLVSSFKSRFLWQLCKNDAWIWQ